jgi:CheY-like chemotaxis protein
MNGFELAQHLRALCSARPPVLVAVTGYGQTSDMARTEEAGFAEHFVKPVDFDRLEATVRRIQASKR